MAGQDGNDDQPLPVRPAQHPTEEVRGRPGSHGRRSPSVPDHPDRHRQRSRSGSPQRRRITLHRDDSMDRPRHVDENDNPRMDKIFKSFKIQPFSGNVAPGAFDAGAAAWFEGFKLQLYTEENIFGVYLTERAKNALLFRNLSGDARDWYIANQGNLVDRDLDSLGRRLKREFGSRLTKLQVCEMVANERKRPSESYQQFSLRLRNMAAANTPDHC